MTLKRTEMARGTTPLRSTKPMSRGTVAMSRSTGLAHGTSAMSRGTGIARGTSQLARTGPIKAKMPSEKVQVAVKVAAVGPVAEAPKARKRALKTTRPKMTAIRLSAKDEECTLRFPCCNHRTDTTVLCHRNGAGGGMKAPDTDAAYGCYACHTVLDGHAPRPEGFTRAMMLERFDVAVGLTHIRLAIKGLIRLLAGGGVEEVVGAAEIAAQKNKSRHLLATGIGFNSDQLIGQSMSKKIVPHINCVVSTRACEYVDFSTEINTAEVRP